METATKPVGELAGRELDVAVQEEVFGGEVVDLGGGGRMEDDGKTFRIDPSAVPIYSTDIAAAWEVFCEVGDLKLVEKLRDGAFLVGDYGYSGIVPPLSRAETAPEAICRAALKAVRSDA